ncbi:MAG: ABC-type transporter, integral rane subunit [Firmicutes bacterium]|nr:ABC-type transporter, integral rane subunit [Bacillota bacterium]
MLMNLLTIFKTRYDDILLASWEHLQLTFIALLIAILIAIPLGILLTRHKKWAEPIIGVTAIFQTIPSMALLGFMIPMFGIGPIPAIIALTIYGLLPILRNTYTGIIGVTPAAVEAGVGMGMTSLQVLFMVELPMALSFIMAGVRTATVLIVGVATLAALIGAGGLGDLIFRGIAMANSPLILSGALPAALLAIILDFALKWLEYKVQPTKLK